MALKRAILTKHDMSKIDMMLQQLSAVSTQHVAQCHCTPFCIKRNLSRLQMLSFAQSGLFTGRCAKREALGSPAATTLELQQPLKHNQSQSHTHRYHSMSRRKLFVLVPVLISSTSLPLFSAKAGAIQDALKEKLRPEIDELDAIIQMLDARGVLYEIRDLAATPLDSLERKSSNSLLPGYAKRLRKVGNAAPTVAALAAGTDKEAQVSQQFGGEAETASLTDPVLITIGQVLNYSGRGLNPDALQNPLFAKEAINAVEEPLEQVPASSMDAAKAQREAARAARKQ